MTPDEILTAAREYLEANGWHQGASYNAKAIEAGVENPPACAMGAIEAAVGGVDFKHCHTPAMRAAAQRLADQLPDEDGSTYGGFFPRSIGSIVDYNDEPTTTQEDVLLLFKKAARDDA